ncbi:hypothetical protein JW752_05495 [Candidatus Peregrinibacteria bacterium]|nr:hypothetical protein [Candidatus Peregrinibacteria bacterium]
MFLFHHPKVQKPDFIYFAGEETPQESGESQMCTADSCQLKIETAEKDLGTMFEEMGSVYGLNVDTRDMDNMTFYQFKNKEGKNVMDVAYDADKDIYYLVDYTPFGQRPLGQAKSVDDLMTLSLNNALENNTSQVDKQLRSLVGGMECEVSTDNEHLMKNYLYKNPDGAPVFHVTVDYRAGTKPVFHYVEHTGSGTEMQKLSSEELEEVAYVVRTDREKTMVAARERGSR